MFLASFTGLIRGVICMGDARELMDSYFTTSRVALKQPVPVRCRGTGRMIRTDLVRGRERRKAQACSATQ